MELIDFYTKEKYSFKEKMNAYVCGPTVYNDAHIGNIRPILVFDILNRNSNLNVIHNITDIDDKIIAKALELKISENDLSKKYEMAYQKLLKDLNIVIPNEMPKVTDHIEGMIKFINRLIKNENAYVINGSVYFSVNKLENYGKFANLKLDTLIDEENLEEKRDTKDFAIWKSTKIGQNFESPWGKGRPGWHTECSFFIENFFGEKGIDIHGGGIDLKFPHHVNEIAQFEAYHNKKINNKWLYVGHITMNNEKMSKSLGNVIYAKDFIKEHGYDVLRHLLLSVQYLKPINVNNDTIFNSVNAMNKIKNVIIKTLLNNSEEVVLNPKATIASIKALNDNLNTAEVFTNIFKQVKIVNGTSNKQERNSALNYLIGDLSLLGIEYKLRFNELKDKIILAKKEKNYTLLDKYRKEVLTC